MNRNDTYDSRLERHGIRPTPVRVMILRAMYGFSTAFDMNDIERSLDTVDRSSISRTLKLFTERHLIHSIDDGSGSVRYSLCDEEGLYSLDHRHVHFTCTSCRRTFCIRDVHVPIAGLPAGFVLYDVNYVLKGLCSECAAHAEAESVLKRELVTHRL